MITVKDFLEKITNPDRIKIVKGEEVLFAGYKGALVHEGAADLSPDILTSIWILAQTQKTRSARNISQKRKTDF